MSLKKMFTLFFYRKDGENMAKTKAQIEFEAVTSGFDEGIKSMDQSLGTLRKELKLNSTELKENADDVDKLAERKELLQKESDASAEKVELLTKKLNEAERIFGSNSKEVQLLNNKLLDAKTVYQGIQNEIKQTDNKMDQLKNGTKQLDNAMDDAKNSAQNLDGGFSVLKDTMGDLLADGVQELSGALKDLAVDSDTAHSSFQAQTGASKDEMVEFESAMEEIYANNFGESLNDIANAMAEVKQQTKETDPSKLKDLTQNALVLRDTFDMDVKESMRAVNSLMNQFGIDGDEAFNLIVQGAQNGLNANDDLLDTINEYSVQFKNAGYSADDMLNMLYNGASEGTWSIDKLGDAVKEMNIRFSDGTVTDALDENKKALGLTSKEVKNLTAEFNKGGDSSKQAIGKVIDSIMSVEDETERYKLGVSVFGTMWEDLGADTINSLMNTKGEINSTKGAMEELTNVKYDNITSELGEMSRSLKEDILIPVVQDLLPVLKDGLTWIKDNLNWLLPVITGIGIAIATYFVVSKFMSFIGVITQIINLVKTGTTVFGALNTVMALNPIALIVTAIVGLIAVFVLLWNKCDGFREFWIGLWEKIKEIFGIVVDGIKAGFQTFMDFLKSAGDWINTNVIQPIIGFFNSLWDGIKAVWEGIQTGFQTFLDFLGTCASWINDNVIQPIINFFKSLWDGIKAVWDGICLAIQIAFGLIVSIIDAAFQLITLPFRFIWENCKGIVTDVFNSIKTFISNAINTIKTVITTVFTAIKTFFSNVWNGIKTIFTTVWNAIVGFLTPIITTIKNVISTTFNAIKNTISTIFNTIHNVVTTVWNTIKDAISTVINTIKEVISNVFNTIRETISNVVNTIRETISNVFNTIKSKITSVVNGVKTTISNVFTSIKDKISNIVTGVKDKIVNTFNSVKDKVTSIFNTIKEKMSKPVEKARDTIKGIVDKIKGFFDFEFKTPKIKVPKFAVTPKGWKVGDLLEGKIPKLSIKWNAKGGIFTKPTILDSTQGVQGVSEAGPEAILPLERLETWINNGFNHIMSSVNSYIEEKIDRLIEINEQIRDKSNDMYVDGRKVTQSTAGYSDDINGQRLNLKSRGVIL